MSEELSSFWVTNFYWRAAWGTMPQKLKNRQSWWNWTDLDGCGAGPDQWKRLLCFGFLSGTCRSGIDPTQFAQVVVLAMKGKAAAGWRRHAPFECLRVLALLHSLLISVPSNPCVCSGVAWAFSTTIGNMRLSYWWTESWMFDSEVGQESGC